MCLPVACAARHTVACLSANLQKNVDKDVRTDCAWLLRIAQASADTFVQQVCVALVAPVQNYSPDHVLTTQDCGKEAIMQRHNVEMKDSCSRYQRKCYQIV